MFFCCWQNSLTRSAPLNSDSQGRFGNRFLSSYDHRFVIKTVSSEDIAEMHNILKKYHQVEVHTPHTQADRNVRLKTSVLCVMLGMRFWYFMQYFFPVITYCLLICIKISHPLQWTYIRIHTPTQKMPIIIQHTPSPFDGLLNVNVHCLYRWSTEKTC